MKLKLKHWLLAAMLAGASVQVTAAEYTASFKNVEIEEFINTIGRNLNKTIIYDPSVRGKVNVRSYETLNDDQYYQFFLNVLEVYGFAVVEMDNNILKVIKNKDAKGAAIPVVGDEAPGQGDEFVTRVVPVYNVSVRELAPLLRQLNDNAGGGNVVHYDPSNVIMITGRAAVVARLYDIIQRVDKAGDQDVDIVKLGFASATEMVRIIESLTRAQGGKGNTPEFLTPKIVADDRTNSLIVSGDPKARARIVGLIQRLDREMENTGNTKVFYLKYAKAKDLVAVLTGVSESIAAENQAASGSKSNKRSSRREISIEAHEDSNALVITAEPDMMQSLEAVIRQLDIRRAQVHIEAIIVEVLEGDGASFGIQYFSDEYGALQYNTGNQVPVAGLWVAGQEAMDEDGNTVCEGIGSDQRCTTETIEGDYTMLAELLGGVNGIMAGVIKNDWAAVVQAVKTSSNSNVLATPSITTLDNQEAYFIVGAEVPILTGSTASSNNTNPFQTIERQEVGIKLQVTPQINEGDAVQLEIEQEVSGVSGATAVDITINNGQLKTTVMADDGGTIVLGGLIDEDTEESESKVPLLGDIPGIGQLFRSTTTSKSKRNLLVFIRPTIVRDGATMNTLSNRKYNYMRAEQLNKEKELFLLNEQTPVLPEWNDPQALPQTIEEFMYLKSQEKN